MRETVSKITEKQYRYIYIPVTVVKIIIKIREWITYKAANQKKLASSKNQKNQQEPKESRKFLSKDVFKK